MSAFSCINTRTFLNCRQIPLLDGALEFALLRSKPTGYPWDGIYIPSPVAWGPYPLRPPHNRKAEPFESEEKRKESRTDSPKHRSFIGATSREHDPMFRQLFNAGKAHFG
jgi:hypothetical protein